MRKNLSFILRVSMVILLLVMTLSAISCDKLPFGKPQGGDQNDQGNNGQTPPEEEPECLHESVVDGKCTSCREIIITSISELPLDKYTDSILPDGSVSRQLYYVKATVKELLNSNSGEMIIEDETGSIRVASLSKKNGTTYGNMSERPDELDEILIHCTLEKANGEWHIRVAYLVEFTAVEPQIDSVSIAEAREAEAGTLVSVSGVVAQIAYANGHVPTGVILVDETGSIYVYGRDIAAEVKVGNKITVNATKAYWILEDEVNNAEKFGYKGSCQLEYAKIISNDKGTNSFDKSWIEETTVKEVMDTPVTENITNKIFKVNALIKKAPGNGFTNYYIDDIDGITGSYVYTQCNGSDFSWLDKFDGKICTVYFVAMNAKSSSSGCVWRLLPVEVIDEGYVFDTTKAAEYAVKYHGVGQFLSSYTGDPKTVLQSVVSSELLGFEGATLSYSSSDEAVVYFTTDNEGNVTFHCGNAGNATVTVAGSYNGLTYSETVEITVEENKEHDYISIADAIAKEVGEEVIIRGIVGPSVVNQEAFYLFDESGMVAVKVYETSIFETIEIGHEVVIKGTRDMWHKSGYDHGQIVISDATVEANYYGEHDYLTFDPISDKDLTHLISLDKLDMSETTKLYRMTVSIKVVDSAYYSNIYVSNGDKDLILYCSSATQYNWLKAYDGQTVTVEIAPCNWNSKANFGACVLAVVNEDGTKELNSYNFK